MSEPLLQRIPGPEDVEFELTDAMDTIRMLHARVRELTPAGADALLKAGENLPMPDGPALLASTQSALDALSVPDASSVRANLDRTLTTMSVRAAQLNGALEDANQLASVVKAVDARVHGLVTWLDQSALLRTTLAGQPIDVATHLSEQTSLVNERLARVVSTDEAALTRLDGLLLALAPTGWYALITADLSSLSAIDPLVDTQDYIDALDGAFQRASGQIGALVATLSSALAIANVAPVHDHSPPVADSLFALAIGGFSGGARARLLHEMDRHRGRELPIELFEASSRVDELLTEVDAEQRAITSDALALALANDAQTVFQSLHDMRAQLAAHVAGMQQAIADIPDPATVLASAQASVESLVRATRALLPVAEPLAAALEKFVDSLAPLILTLDTEMVAEGIVLTLQDALEVLKSPEVVSAIADARSQGLELSQILKRVALASILKRTNADLNALTSALQGVDLSGLPAHLKASVETALAQVHGLNMPAHVAGTLRAAYDAAFRQAAEQVQPFRAAHDQLREKLATLEPAALLQPVMHAYQSLMEDISAIEPENSLAPVKAVYARLRDVLSGFQPNALLATLTISWQERHQALATLRDNELYAPARTIANTLNRQSVMPVELGNVVTGVLQRLAALSGQWPTGERVQALRDRLELGAGDAGPDSSWSLVPSADIDAVRTHLDSVTAATPVALSRLEQTLGQSDAIDISGHIALLDNQWSAERDRLAAMAPAGPVPEPLATHWSYIQDWLAALEPTPLFVEVTSLTEALRTRLEEKRDECAVIVQHATALVTAVRAGMAGPLTSEFAELISALVTHDEYRGTRLEALTLADLVASVRVHLDAMRSHCERMKSAANAMATTLQDVAIPPESSGVGALQSALAAHDPSHLVDALQPLYDRAELALEQLYPADIFDNLDTRYYRDIRESLTARDPASTVLPVATPVYEAVQEAMRTVDIATILQDALDALVTIESAFIAGVTELEGLVSNLPEEGITKGNQ